MFSNDSLGRNTTKPAIYPPCVYFRAHWPNLQLPDPTFLRLRVFSGHLSQLCQVTEGAKELMPFWSSPQVVVGVSIPQLLLCCLQCVLQGQEFPREITVFPRHGELPGNSPFICSSLRIPLPPLFPGKSSKTTICT